MTLAVQSSGQGPDLVLLHGWGMHAGFWQPLAAELSAHYSVHVVDLPGHGHSPAGDLSLASVVDLLAQRFPGPVVPIGWSLGGLYALEWAHRYPQQIERLVLLATNPCFAQREDWPHAMPSDTLQSFMAAFADEPRAVLQRFIGLMARGEPQARRWMREWLALVAPSVLLPAVWMQGLHVLAETDWREQCHRLSQSLLLLYGADDALVPIGAAQWLASVAPSAHLCRLEACGHVPHVTQAPACLAAIREFLA